MVEVGPIIKCPECKEEIVMDIYAEVGDVLTCEHCEIELEVIKVDPIELKVVGDLSYTTDKIDHFEELKRSGYYDDEGYES
ncbi:MAG: hypothetical protein ABH869_00345 [Candidatus Omnitrophota bacterium]